MSATIRIVTYNVHKCRGIDGRTDPLRIARILREINPDIASIQEIVHGEGSSPNLNQARAIWSEMPDYEFRFGSNRFHQGAPYGNMTLSRFPVRVARNYNLTWKKCEGRGCLRTDVDLPNGELLHVFNLHLGTSFIERRGQGRLLLSTDILRDAKLNGHRVVVGDFNEWTRGLASRLMSNNFESVDLRAYLRIRRTYPGLLPLLHLDDFYFDKGMALTSFSIYRTRSALLASDHLPLVAEFEIGTTVSSR